MKLLSLIFGIFFKSKTSGCDSSLFNALGLLIAVLIVICASAVWAQEGALPDAERYVPGELLVKFKSEATAEQKQSLRGALQAHLVKVIKQLGVEHWRLPQEMLAAALERLNSDPLIEYAEPNFIYHPMAVPDDDLYNQLWFLSNSGQTVAGRSGTVGADIDAEAAWEITTGSKDVVIAVIDSGVALDHPDLKNNIWTNAGEIPDDGIDNDNNDYIDDVHGWDFARGETGDNDPTDVSTGTISNGHGTHVAGIIAGEGNNQQGITGVMWQAQIMPLLCYDLYFTDLPYSDDIHAIKIGLAILYAVENGARIINMSFTGPSQSEFIFDALKSADMNGVLAVAAAGNDANDNDVSPRYPADYDLPNILSVAATDENDELSSFSNYGVDNVDVAAPGGDHPNGIADNLLSTTPPQRKTLFSEDFESGAGQWVTTSEPEAWSLDVDVATSTWIQDSAGNYHNNENSYVRTANGIDTSNCRGLHFEFDISYLLESNYDFLYFEASPNNTNYSEIVRFTGSGSQKQNFWSNQLTLDTLYLRFRLVTDEATTDDGVYIDNIKVTGIPWTYDGDEYGFKVGTSMAAPVVAGVAGLLLSYDPNLTHYEVKAAIENSVDKLDALTGKVATGGRVNAYKALQYVGASIDNPSPGPDPESEPDPDPEPEEPQDETNNGGGGGGGCFIDSFVDDHR